MTTGLKPQKQQEPVQQAMKNPGVKEVMDLFNASFGIYQLRDLQIVPQDTYVRFTSDTTRPVK